MAIHIETSGEMYFRSDTKKGVRSFTQKVVAPSMEYFHETADRYLGLDSNGKKMYKTTSFLNIRGQLKKKILPRMLKLKFEDFVRVRIVVIESITTDSGADIASLPIKFRSRRQLAEYIKTNKLPFIEQEYPNIDELRFDIREYETDPENFMRNKEQRDKQRALDYEFMKLNGLLDAQGVGVSSEPQGKNANTNANTNTNNRRVNASITNL